MILAFIGTTELLLIGGLALLLFGGKKLPEMMRGLGKGVREFKDGMNEISSPDKEEIKENSTQAATGDQEQTADQNETPSKNSD